MSSCPSFDDLFQATHGREINAEERDRFRRLSQPDLNEHVRKWVERSGGKFICYDQVGSDGVTYTAFDYA